LLGVTTFGGNVNNQGDFAFVLREIDWLTVNIGDLEIVKCGHISG
jgi:hypothetical protein